MSIGWGWKIGLLYGGFMALIIGLVIASTRQHFDLVSKDYYRDEVAYQKVIDAGKNQAGLSMPAVIHATAQSVIIDFPADVKDAQLSGEVRFYSPIDAAWDHVFKIEASNNSIVIPRQQLRNTRYIIKMSYNANGTAYYQESEITLHD